MTLFWHCTLAQNYHSGGESIQGVLHLFLPGISRPTAPDKGFLVGPAPKTIQNVWNRRYDNKS